MAKNKFYNTKHWQLIKVAFRAGGDQYTYAAHVSHKCKAGEVVVVPVGNHEDISSIVNIMSVVQFAIVMHVTSDMKHLPTKYAIKHIVSKVDTGLYTRAFNAKEKRAKP